MIDQNLPYRFLRRQPLKRENANNTTETPTHREQRQTKSIFGLFGYWRHIALDW